MMRIKFNPYRRQDGSWMLYVNSDRRVSIGISEDRGMPAPYGRRTTKGQRNLLKAIYPALENAEDMQLDGKPDFNAHEEDAVQLEIGDLYLTDIATIGGVPTGSDGAFLVTKSGKVINLSYWIEV